MQLAKCVEEFMRMSEAQHARGTAKKYRALLDGIVAENWPETLTGAQIGARVEDWRTRRLASRNKHDNGRLVARSTVAAEMALLHAFFTYCARHAWMPAVPFPRPIKFVRPRPQVLDGFKLKRMMAACQTPREKCLLILAVKAGLRRMELQTLEWEDMREGMIYVTPKPKWGFIPKGYKERTVPMPPELVELGRGLRGLVFPTKHGRPTLHLIEEIKAIAGRAGLEERIWLHLMRHTFGTSISRETDIRTVQDLLGHADLKTTMAYLEPARDKAEIINKAIQL